MRECPIRLLALDLDGTLFRDDGLIRPRVKQAITAAQARGVIVSLATGRALSVAGRYAGDLGLTGPLITYQGAVVYDPAADSILFAVHLPAEVIPEIVARARALDLDLHFQADGRVYVEKLMHGIEFYAEIFGQPVMVVNDLALLPEPPVKAVVVCQPDQALALVARLRAEFAGRLEVVRTHAILVEGVPLGVSKGAALPHLADYLDIPQNAVMAIGDNDNDVSMLAWAGLGVAMGNATAACRAAADWIAPPIEEDGAAEAIERFILDP